ncbi:MAG TPA: TIGR03560 family F420-dependent LLM class oxidoreductase [Pseudonocardia sp.]|jgi:F420-dependent oxidoreductase-like protein|uniref:TIGR03560 family F420-dependent LLM class oxidoreductase n=1 Tax=Pseudonocardia sp. TaxID=60912 RepID=UPI002B4AF336|nr:TIGR03560 family F420-dependent LLM class oxidoreductase [Pseudonocardia sp.]HLU56825.1 TIGR03560 family F420-dependent LLM class oxidoreductase [Pseudonocardia sp.]
MTTLRMRVLMEPRHGARYEEIRALALATEEAGFDAFFRSDHLMGVDPHDATYRPTECWTTLGGLARDTTRVRLGALVSAATFREPGLLAAIVASVDEMSGGRAELGIGTGWYEREHEAFGIPFPPARDRFDRLSEQLAVITGLWSGPGFSHAGAHYRVVDNRTPPRPTQRPHPPIIVGGSGPRRTPAIAARYATEFNGALTTGGGAAGLKERFERFARACEAIGRDPATARLSAVLPVACGATPVETQRRAEVIGSELMRANAAIGSPAEVTDRVGELADAGADTVYLHIYDIHDLDHIALIGAEVLPHVAPSRTGAMS